MCLTGFFFFNDTATTEIYTLSLHDALPISSARAGRSGRRPRRPRRRAAPRPGWPCPPGGRSRCARSEEHTSELQSRQYLVCRLLLEKKKEPLATHLHSDHLPPLALLLPQV